MQDVTLITIICPLLSVVAGIWWGAHEAYYADRRLFEKICEVDPLSFAGSQSWKRNYVDKDPAKAYKGVPNIHRDIKHASAFLGRYGQFAALAASAWFQDVLALAMCVFLYSTIANLTYKGLRKEAARKISES